MYTSRKISREEREKVNPKIREKLGSGCVITSGSRETTPEGRIRYNIVTYQKELPEETLKKVGKIVKQKLFTDADEVFYYGRKLA